VCKRERRKNRSVQGPALSAGLGGGDLTLIAAVPRPRSKPAQAGVRPRRLHSSLNDEESSAWWASCRANRLDLSTSHRSGWAAAYLLDRSAKHKLALFTMTKPLRLQWADLRPDYLAAPASWRPASAGVPGGSSPHADRRPSAEMRDARWALKGDGVNRQFRSAQLRYPDCATRPTPTQLLAVPRAPNRGEAGSVASRSRSRGGRVRHELRGPATSCAYHAGLEAGNARGSRSLRGREAGGGGGHDRVGMA